MIARNEESFIEGCLESVRDVCHETIVVDTGSTDRTREIARAAGAQVLEAPWTDDFATARNVGVERATGSHVLVLDADERLGPGMGPSLIDAAADPNLLLGCLPLYNASTLDATPDEILDGTKLLNGPVFVPRLFRNLPEMRFERRVHETLTRGFNDLQASGVGQSIAVGAALIHYGDVPTHREDHAKDERNERLLRMSLEDDEADGEIAGYLVVQLIKRGLIDEARRVGEGCFGAFIERNENRPEGHLPDNMVRIGYALGLAQAETGAPEAGLETVRTAQRFTPDGHPN
ncbi:MAG: glycosyltransferase family 2 protein, partial [Planctomycetota bacterium]|nr:glycosyltransferase family 2 protein [Planctomycetota bacterium]